MYNVKATKDEINVIQQKLITHIIDIKGYIAIYFFQKSQDPSRNLVNLQNQ